MVYPNSFVEMFVPNKKCLCSTRNSRGNLWSTHHFYGSCSPSHQSRILLANNPQQCYHIGETVWSMLEIRIGLYTTLYRADHHIFSIDIRPMGDGHIRPFPKSTRNKQSILVVVDYFTKWVEMKALTDIIANKVFIYIYKNIICKFRIPKVLVTDNGTQFDNHKMKEQCQSLHINHRFSSMSHH